MKSFSFKVCGSMPTPQETGMATKIEFLAQTVILSYERTSKVAHPRKSAVNYYATIWPMNVPSITCKAAPRQTT